MDVSIIIPFFNSGPFIQEAVESAKNASLGFTTELIIVDDGSTEPQSLEILRQIGASGDLVVVKRSNGGPAAARNTGVKHATGKYLLFLDSDNKLRPEFISTALPVLESDTQAGVVYGNAAFFGETTERKSFSSRPFDKYALLLDNYIDVCSLVKRKAFDDVAGFDEDRSIIGYEDWEFWIRLSSTPWQFIYLPKILFDYRLRIASVITAASTDENYKRVMSYVYAKNASIFQQYYNELYHENLFYQRDKNQPTRSYLKFLKGKYFSR